jgi:hypothetical protein
MTAGAPGAINSGVKRPPAVPVFSGSYNDRDTPLAITKIRQSNRGQWQNNAANIAAKIDPPAEPLSLLPLLRAMMRNPIESWPRAVRLITFTAGASSPFQSEFRSCRFADWLR